MDLPAPESPEDLMRLVAWKSTLADACTYFAIARNSAALFRNDQWISSVAGQTLLSFAVPKAMITAALVAVCQIIASGYPAPGVSGNYTDSVKRLREQLFRYSDGELGWASGRTEHLFTQAKRERDKLLAHYEPIAADQIPEKTTDTELLLRGPNPWYRPDSFVELERASKALYEITIAIIVRDIERKAQEQG